MEKKYEVAEAIWLAAAVFAYEQYIMKDELALSDVCLKAPELQKMAQEFTDKVVQPARIHQYNNGDHPNCSHRYLRRLEVSSGNPIFRITATGELNGDREYPDSINLNDEIEYEGTTYGIKDIKDFLDKKYAEFIKKQDFSQKRKNGSWEKLTEKIVMKKCDETLFKYGVAAIPIEIRSFFEVEDLETNDKKYIILIFDGEEYSVYIEKIRGITRIKWGKVLKIQFEAFNKTDNYPTCKFAKTAVGKYEVTFETINRTSDKKSDTYWPSLEEYDPGISSEKWIELLTETKIVNEDTLCMLYNMLELGGESTCANLAERYGGSAYAYNSWGRTLGERAHKETGCPLCKDEDRERLYTIPFVGRNVEENGHSRYSWKLRDELKEALESEMMIDVKDKIKAFKASKKDVSYDKNLILYGPPGTGKTYNSVIYAVKICEPDFDISDYDKVMEKYNQLKAEHRIEFTTFHQSYGYEEFIEGIRPVLDGDSNELGYKIEPGVFKKFCEMARTPANIAINPNASIWFMRLESDNAKTIKNECFQENVLIMDIKEDDDWSKAQFVDVMQIGDYVISYAGNSVYIDAIGVIEGEAVRDSEKERYQWSRKVNWTKLEEKVDVKSINSDTYLPNFSIAKMNHMKASDLLRLLPNNAVDEEKPYVFIIDEINRGNISKIFGELITLIETTKREGGAEPANAILPYSGQSFSVPSNVYILGTMNTADRSIQLMDTALRRRFSFIEMMPDTDVLRKMDIGELNFAGTTLDVAAMLDAINDRIAFLYDREHTIGHAFFTGLKENPSIEKLASIFEKSVIPLLQEYFYEDYQKIQLVLGDNAKTDPSTKFILDKKVELNSLFMGNVEDVVDEKEVKYEINPEAFRNIQSYKGIANGL